jgi:hypothetical protein
MIAGDLRWGFWGKLEGRLVDGVHLNYLKEISEKIEGNRETKDANK